MRRDKIQKPSDALHTTPSYLMGWTDDPFKLENAPALTDKDKRDVVKDVEKIMGNLEDSGELMFDGVPMSDEAKASMAAAMKLGLEAARAKNKETYTPKKYRGKKEQ